ncbi:MAG: hypothetical protein NTW38_11785 [Candidatus Aminicenantes bacterium]|nr:hypothetical protein [Candidatus Aminicenantes bacterium]
MEMKRKQIQMRQKAHFEQKLKDRLAFLSGKGIKSPKAEKDTIARKWKADIKAINKRLRLIDDHEKRTEEMAKIKAEKAAPPQIEAAPKKEKEGGKGEKPKKAPEEGKEKKVKAEKKASPPKAPEGVKS